MNRRISFTVRSVLSLLLLSSFSAFTFADRQIVTISPEMPAFGENDQEIDLQVVYSTDPANLAATGLGLKLYFNSALLEGLELTANEELGGSRTGPSVQKDTSDGDGDPNTDFVIVTAWQERTETSGFGNVESVPWPEVEDFSAGVALLNLKFGRKDPAFSGTTTINLALETAACCEAQAESVDVIFKDDETPPEISFKDDEREFTVEAQGPQTSFGDPIFETVLAAISVSDNKDELSVQSVVFSLTEDGAQTENLSLPVGTSTAIFLRVYDSSGNVAKDQITVSMIDSTSPTIVFTDDRTVTFAAVDANGISRQSAVVVDYEASISAVDSVSGDLTASLIDDAPDVFPLGKTVVTLSVADAAGNTATEQITVNVTDQTAPVIAGGEGKLELEANAKGGYEGDSSSIIAAVTVKDNVDSNPLVELAPGTPTVLPLGETTIQIAATDAAGNSSQASVIVRVVDTTKPEISGSDTSVDGSTGQALSVNDSRIQSWLASVTATDIVDGEIAVSNNAPEEFAFGVSTRVTFTATDSSGNTESVVYSLSLSPDDVLPEISGPDNITVEAVGAEGTPATASSIATFLNSAKATDNIDGDISDKITTNAPDIFPLGDTVVTFTIKDSSNNAAEAQATVSVVDTVAPDISPVLLEQSIAAVDGEGSPLTALKGFLDGVTATDLVDGQVEITVEAPEQLPLGETAVTLKAVDSSGNSSTVSILVTVLDQTPPAVSSKDLIIEATSADGAAITQEELLAQITASDNVDEVTEVTLDTVAGVLALGSTTITAVVTDSAGNSATSTFVVNVVDTTPPEIFGLGLLILTVDDESPVPSSDPRFSSWLDGITATDLVDGDVALTTSEIPAEFQIGRTQITFTAIDSAGNKVMVSQDVLVAVGPSVEVPDAITLVSINGGPVLKSQSQVAAFLNGATAKDFSGQALEVSDDAPDSIPVGETVVTFSAVDGEGREGKNTSSITIVVASAENDTDDDGMDDLFEVDNGLDPNDAADAEADADGDGRTNLDEYLEGKDPNADDVAPAVSAPADLYIDSTGLVTNVDLGEATAIDTLDGELTAFPDKIGPFESGKNVVTWSATDAAGNTGSDAQIVVVSPQVTIAPMGRTAEGEVFSLLVSLNGPAPAYPISVPFSLGGTATQGDDYSLVGTDVVFESGRKAMIEITILSDALGDEGTETIVVTLGKPSADAVLGSANEAVISIVEDAVPPVLKVSISQGASKGKKLAADGGTVTAELVISDPNGEHSIDWTQSNSSLVSTSGTDTRTFSFDPAGLEGTYNLTAVVTDSGITDSNFTISVNVLISATSIGADKDGDGISDDKDRSEESNVIPVDADVNDRAAISDPGTTLVLGDAANASGKAGILLSEESLAQSSGADDPDNDYPMGIFDFEVQDLSVPGSSVRVVVPLPAPIPADARMTKYTEGNGWTEFVSDEANGYASAFAEGGACPDVGSDVYVDGLIEGDTCLQLIMQDGGPNDADGELNGVLVDPSGIAVATPVKAVSVNTEGYQARKKVGGGCSVTTGNIDLGLVILLILASIGLLRRKVIN